MAKRKRLEVPQDTFSPELETKSVTHTPRVRMPIADVAGDIAGQSALEEVAAEMTAAEDEGRIARRLPIDRIDSVDLSRDRMVFDPEEMEALESSIRERGQQTPIEVMRARDRYELISGARRLKALRSLGATEILAFVRRPAGAVAAHIAMVEENEIRAPLSFYERANLAVRTSNSGVFDTPADAIAALFARAPAAKRSKIARFVVIRNTLNGPLSFPAAIPEKLGLQLASAIEADEGFARRLSQALKKTPPQDAAQERQTLERALKAGGKETSKPPARVRDEVAPGLTLATRKGRVVFTGAAVDDAFLKAVRDWAVSHAKQNVASD